MKRGHVKVKGILNELLEFADEGSDFIVPGSKSSNNASFCELMLATKILEIGQKLVEEEIGTRRYKYSVRKINRR
jgi:hypothetical protein